MFGECNSSSHRICMIMRLLFCSRMMYTYFARYNRLFLFIFFCFRNRCDLVSVNWNQSVTQSVIHKDITMRAQCHFYDGCYWCAHATDKTERRHMQKISVRTCLTILFLLKKKRYKKTIMLWSTDRGTLWKWKWWRATSNTKNQTESCRLHRRETRIVRDRHEHQMCGY